MNEEYELPQRRLPARQPILNAGNRSNIIFLTVCAKDRKPILAKEEFHHVLIKAWKASDRYVVGKYIILPDHIHLFCSPAFWPEEPLADWVKYWKALVSKDWPNREERPIWQKSFWDRQLRRGDSYSAKWSYVKNNPVRHNLVQNTDEWPYKGELVHLLWHD